MPTDTACVTSVEMVMARLLYFLATLPALAEAPTTCSQRRSIRLSAMHALTSLQPVDQFDKQRILLHVLLIALLRRALAGLLQHDARNDKHGNGAQRQNHQRPADISQQEQKPPQGTAGR